MARAWRARALSMLLVPLAATADHSWVSDGSASDAVQEPELVDMQSVLTALGLLSGAFLVVLIGLRVYLHCVRRRPQRQERRKKMTLADIESKFPVTKCEGFENEETCVVCLCNIEAGEDIRVTQCGHTFHADCLQQWWLHKPRRVLRCPICRKRQRTKDGRSKRKELQLPEGDLDGVVVEDAGNIDPEGTIIPGELVLPPPSTAAPTTAGDVDHSSSEDAGLTPDNSVENEVGIAVTPSPKAAADKIISLDGPAPCVTGLEDRMTVTV